MFWALLGGTIIINLISLTCFLKTPRVLKTEFYEDSAMQVCKRTSKFKLLIIQYVLQFYGSYFIASSKFVVLSVFFLSYLTLKCNKIQGISLHIMVYFVCQLEITATAVGHQLNLRPTRYMLFHWSTGIPFVPLHDY